MWVHNVNYVFSLEEGIPHITSLHTSQGLLGCDYPTATLHDVTTQKMTWIFTTMTSNLIPLHVSQVRKLSVLPHG